MSLDYRTISLYGWKVKEKDIQKLTEELENWNEDCCDEFIVEDIMCGRYIYIGVILAYFDPTEDYQEVIINDKLIDEKTKKWNKYINDNPEFLKIINKYKSGEPQLFVFNRIW